LKIILFLSFSTGGAAMTCAETIRQEGFKGNV